MPSGAHLCTRQNGLCKLAFLQKISYVTKILSCGEVEGA